MSQLGAVENQRVKHTVPKTISLHINSKNSIYQLFKNIITAARILRSDAVKSKVHRDRQHAKSPFPEMCVRKWPKTLTVRFHGIVKNTMGFIFAVFFSVVENDEEARSLLCSVAADADSIALYARRAC
ncbi:MAG: hypothetical protein KDK05_12480 [Candidatus Competibacteraceae bacterium]|nr:hypothetical protein [Candidatus Competibacteraceae bacterium]